MRSPQFSLRAMLLFIALLCPFLAFAWPLYRWTFGPLDEPPGFHKNLMLVAGVELLVVAYVYLLRYAEAIRREHEQECVLPADARDDAGDRSA